MGKYIDYLDIQEEVKAALEEHRGVVALESTIISMACRIRKMWKWQKIVNALSEKQVPCLQRSPS